jgi:hypothetical protein
MFISTSRGQPEMMLEQLTHISSKSYVNAWKNGNLVAGVY